MRTTIDLPDDVHELLKYLANARGESMGATVASVVRAAGQGDPPPTQRIERDPETGLLLLVGGTPRSDEEVRRLAYDE